MINFCLHTHFRFVCAGGYNAMSQITVDHALHFLFQIIGAKVRYAVQCGMRVIACIGEKLSERESGLTEDVVRKQLKAITGQWV